MPLCSGRRANHSGGTPEPSAVHSRTLTVTHVLSAACTLTAPHTPVASLTMANLWAELKRQLLGEDIRITIECRRERHYNLDGDFGATNATLVGQAAHTPTSQDLGVVAWNLPHTSEWWSGCTSSSPTCQRNTTRASAPLSYCRSTPPPSLLQEGMRLSWPTISLWP
jgi:hypothetical protein